MSCGRCCTPCCRSMLTRIALAEDDRGCLIVSVPTRSSTCYAQAGSRQALDQTELCAHSTAHERFQEWVQAGVFLKLWQAGVEQFDELCGIDWDWLSIDGAMTKARALAGKKTGPNPTDRGKSGVKRSLLDVWAWGANRSHD